MGDFDEDLLIAPCWLIRRELVVGVDPYSCNGRRGANITTNCRAEPLVTGLVLDSIDVVVVGDVVRLRTAAIEGSRIAPADDLPTGGVATATVRWDSYVVARATEVVNLGVVGFPLLSDADREVVALQGWRVTGIGDHVGNVDSCGPPQYLDDEVDIESSSVLNRR